MAKKKKGKTDAAADPARERAEAVYVQIMRRLFEERGNGADSFVWERSELPTIAGALGVGIPKNLGDNIYSIRSGRADLPEEVQQLAPPGKYWLILPHGRSVYRCVLANAAFIDPNPLTPVVKVPDATPQIVAAHARGDEQAVLARVAYTRLVDLLLGVSAWELQSHMRTTVEAFKKSQVETDDVYVAVDQYGAQYVIPIQAKGPKKKDRISAVQIIQDIYLCREKFPTLVCQAVAAKTINIEDAPDGTKLHTIALLLLDVDDNFNVSLLRERHYKLVPASMISPEELRKYQELARREYAASRG